MSWSDFAWVPWILTLFTWIIALKISLDSTKRTEINKSIDLFQTMVRDLEDSALKFWMKTDTNIHDYQLTLKLKRITAAANAVVAIDKNQIFPTKEMAAFRQSVTLDIEKITSQTKPSMARMQKIMIASVKLQDHFKRAT